MAQKSNWKAQCREVLQAILREKKKKKKMVQDPVKAVKSLPSCVFWKGPQRAEQGAARLSTHKGLGSSCCSLHKKVENSR